MYLSTSDLLSFIISNSDKHELAVYGNDVDCVIKRDFTSKNCIHVLKISVVYYLLF